MKAGPTGAGRVGVAVLQVRVVAPDLLVAGGTVAARANAEAVGAGRDLRRGVRGERSLPDDGIAAGRGGRAASTRERRSSSGRLAVAQPHASCRSSRRSPSRSSPRPEPDPSARPAPRSGSPPCPVSRSVPGSARLSRMRRFLMLVPGDRPGRRDLVEGLRERACRSSRRRRCRPGRAPGRASSRRCPSGPVVGESEVAIVGPSQQTFEPGREVDGGVDLDLVARRAGNRAPREARVVGLRRRVQILELSRGRSRPEPIERGDGRSDAAVALGVDRRDAPVVGAGRKRRRDRGASWRRRSAGPSDRPGSRT